MVLTLRTPAVLTARKCVFDLVVASDDNGVQGEVGAIATFFENPDVAQFRDVPPPNRSAVFWRWETYDGEIKFHGETWLSIGRCESGYAVFRHERTGPDANGVATARHGGHATLGQAQKALHAKEIELAMDMPNVVCDGTPEMAARILPVVAERAAQIVADVDACERVTFKWSGGRIETRATGKDGQELAFTIDGQETLQNVDPDNLRDAVGGHVDRELHRVCAAAARAIGSNEDLRAVAREAMGPKARKDLFEERMASFVETAGRRAAKDPAGADIQGMAHELGDLADECRRAGVKSDDPMLFKSQVAFWVNQKAAGYPDVGNLERLLAGMPGRRANSERELA